MARGDVVVFNEAKAFLLDGGFESTDTIKVAICDNTAAPSASTARSNVSSARSVNTWESASEERCCISA